MTESRPEKSTSLILPLRQSRALALPDRSEMRDIALAWEAFMAGQDKGLEKIRPVIRESWQRSHRLGVNPYRLEMPLVLPAEELEALQERADLIEIVGPLFDKITKAWEAERFGLNCSDRHGHILYVSGHPWALERAREINAVPGAGMGEEHIGTAIANVVLAQEHADYVAWNEHYCQTFHAWMTVGAPIRHPLSSEAIGVVIAGGFELTHPRAVEVIKDIAERIEQLLHHEELIRRVALLESYQYFLLQHPQDTILAIDGRGYVCGASPSITRLLDTPQYILGRSLLRLPNLQIEGFRSLTREQELSPYDIRIIVPQRGLSLQATAIPICGKKQPVGTIFILSRLNTPTVRQMSSSWLATYTFDDLVGDCAVFQQCVRLGHRAAADTFPVLLSGESGTGKELFAQAIHTASARRSGPFVAVNCGTASDDLLATELFGYVEGSFTGAVKGGKKGKVELAHSGTLFLDEVAEMPAKMQVSLLRVLEEGRVTRVGAERPVNVDVRVIAAANEDLRKVVDEKRFRLDLYHRLASFCIQLPPLRERQEDIPLLVQHLFAQLGFPHLHLTAEALALLSRYIWPGNIRELKNVLLRSSQLVTGTVITPAELPPEIAAVATEQMPSASGSLRETERTLIERAFAEAKGDMTLTAARLGIHRTTLYRKLKRYGLFQAHRSGLPHPLRG